MPPRASTIRPTSGWGSLQTLALFAVFWTAAALVVGEWVLGVGVGSIAFLLYRVFIVRMIICRHHRRGVSLTRAGRFADAITAFERSEAYWSRWRRLDRARGIVLGSAVAWPFRLLARYNQGYCYSRLGQGDDAIRVLTALRQDEPDMRIAAELLEVLEAGASTRAPPPKEEDETWGGMLEDEPSMSPGNEPV